MVEDSFGGRNRGRVAVPTLFVSAGLGRVSLWRTRPASATRGRPVGGALRVGWTACVDRPGTAGDLDSKRSHRGSAYGCCGSDLRRPPRVHRGGEWTTARGESGVGGAGSGSHGRYGGGGGGDGDGDDGDVDPELGAVLRRESRPLSSLPRDVRIAVEAGTVTAAELARVFVVERIFIIGALARAFPALRNRLVANPRFLTIMAVELVLGVVSKTAAEVRQRGSQFWKEFDFYLSDIALEVVGDFALVWLLSPSLTLAPTLLANRAAVSPGTRLSGVLAALPKFALQEGASFTAMQRAGNLALKGAQFGLIGFAASMLGHSLTKTLVKLRQTLNPNEPPPAVQLAPTLTNSLVWGSFMACSSNVRYQLVNALEARLFEPLLRSINPLWMAIASFFLRFGNTYVGGMHWIRWARQAGIQ
ncbi:hypothetical protein CDCA_CDCA07G2110 [Cyanidium caldarium]|uniref:Uncharacterized protein n=1 Tax=Cyanidium caldarium TaxID=2771 RepID=A0AAV9IVG4_CYACA|nr:hypothetical protein CDCA_CDCA07G2110 [Cyanidium caldarium]